MCHSASSATCYEEAANPSPTATARLVLAEEESRSTSWLALAVASRAKHIIYSSGGCGNDDDRGPC